MDDCNCLNCHLQAKWREYYEASEAMVRVKFSVYKEIMAILQKVCTQPVDIDEYWDMAVRLSEFLEQMGQGTVFYNYFFEQINPYHYGNVRYFRHLCLDLREQIAAFNEWRQTRRRLSVVTL
jgi:hypothetical protein